MDEWFEKMSAELSLPENTARQLENDGYFVIEEAVNQAKCARLSQAYDAAVLAADSVDVSASSSTRIHNFVNLGAEFDDLYIYEPLLAACCQIIRRPFKLSAMLGRTLEPGAPAQELHIDFSSDNEGWPMAGFIFMIDEFRNDNGATRFVPGSQMLSHSPGEHQGEVLARGPAGSFIIYNGSVWHGFTANRSAGRRRSIQGAFIRREFLPAINQAARIRPETLGRIGLLAKYLLDLPDREEPN